jgi:hypothetical protein
LKKTFVPEPHPSVRPWRESGSSPENKSLLLLFFRKEELPYFSRKAPIP